MLQNNREKEIGWDIHTTHMAKKVTKASFSASVFLSPLQDGLKNFFFTFDHYVITWNPFLNLIKTQIEKVFCFCNSHKISKYKAPGFLF